MDLLEALRNNSFVNVLLVLAIGYIVWSLKKFLSLFEETLKNHGKLITTLFEKYDGLAQDLSCLEGKHDAIQDYKRRRTDRNCADD